MREKEREGRLKEKGREREKGSILETRKLEGGMRRFFGPSPIAVIKRLEI